MDSNPYLEQVEQALPRVLALFDLDKTSKSYGMGDRFYWAWGLIDFGNGTYQGAAHGLARLWHSNLWPYETKPKDFIQRIDAFFLGAASLTRKNGSLEEAFPNEGSYCVTALAAFDLLAALDMLSEELDQATFKRWLAIIKPMISYLIADDETHAIISNHLATAIAALARWHRITQDSLAEKRAEELLNRILHHQSNEGWFKEYEGADPGYQSLCTYYLADVHQTRPDWKLLEPLRKSIIFLWQFAHPDGSFGGLYGSRCTRFYYPAGLLALSSEVPEAAALANFMSTSVCQNSVVTLNSMDEANLIPMFNAYCWAATLWPELIRNECDLIIPALDTTPKRTYFKEAGLLIDRGLEHYTVVATNKGGVLYHYVNHKLALCDAGVVVSDSNGKLGSTQTYNENNEIDLNDDELVIKSAIYPMPKHLAKPLEFLALRILCVTVFKSSNIRAWVKKRLVSLLITGAKAWPASNIRTITLGNKASVSDKLQLPKGYKRSNSTKIFIPIHMASQGYWQIQDEEGLS